MKDKMAIIGDGDSVLAFRACGVDAYPVSHPETAKNVLKKLAKEYKIIYITDVIAEQIDDAIKKYLDVPYPIILSVPSKNGSNGYGMKGLKSMVNKALGVDVLFEHEEGN